MRFAVGLQVRQVHIVVPVRQKRIDNRSKNARFSLAEVVKNDLIQCSPGLRLMVIMPVGVVPAAAVRHLLRGQTEQEKVFLARFCGHLDGGTVPCADGNGPVHP